MNKIKDFFGSFWCMIFHEWEMPYSYAPWKCKKCGRRWDL